MIRELGEAVGEEDGRWGTKIGAVYDCRTGDITHVNGEVT